MLRLKGGPYGVRLHGLSTPMLIAVIVVKEWMDFYGLRYEISGGSEGEHMVASLHFTGNALDWSVRDRQPSQTIEDMFLRVQENLADDFDVTLNYPKMRLHVEFQPKTSYGRLGS